MEKESLGKASLHLIEYLETVIWSNFWNEIFKSTKGKTAR